MGIAGFSPSVFCAPGASTLLAPVQALVALFMPVQPVKAIRHPVVRAPELRMSVKPSPVDAAPAGVRSRQTTCLRVIREFDPCAKRSHSGRMVISGRMADVCAELDRIAAKESA